MSVSNRILMFFENGKEEAQGSSAVEAFIKSLSFTHDGSDHGCLISEVSGNFDFNAKTLSNLGAPSTGSDAATKTYADTKVAKAGDSMTGALTFDGVSGHIPTGLASPVNATDAVNKAYVDNAFQGVSWKNIARTATTGALPNTPTYANGSSGVGATLTSATNSALAAQDGVTLALNDRILVKDEVTTQNNGLYYLSTVGVNGSVAWVLTRTLDADTSADLVGATVEVGSEATTLAGNVFRQTDPSPITIGTTSIDWTLTNNGSAVTYGSGLYQSGGVVFANPDGVTLDATGATANGNATLEVKSGGIGSTQLASGAVTAAKLGTVTDGVTLDQAATGSKLEIKTGGVGPSQLGSVTDGVTLDQSGSGSTLEIKTGGVSTTQLATAAVSAAKLATVTDGVTLDQSGSGSTLEIKAQGVGPTQLGAVAGTGLTGGSGAALSVDYARTLTNDNAGTVTVGQVVYVKSNGHVDLASQTTASLDQAELGLVQDATIATTASGKITVKPGAIVGGFSSLTPGQRVYVGSTAGTATQTAPSATSGNYVYTLGRAISATEVMFDPRFVVYYV